MSDRIAAREILKARARVLAKTAAPPAEGKSIGVVEFQLASERYAVEHRFVREVAVLRELTALPCAPAFVRGIMNWRGQIVPLLDIKKFFDLPETGITDLHSVIILSGDDMEIGILADAVVGVSEIPLADIEPTLPTLTGIRADYLKGVTGRHVVVLDATRITADPRIIINQEATASHAG
jgi:purine-binding chemotaxis protein CheW